MGGDIALAWERGNEIAPKSIVGREALGVLDHGDAHGIGIEKLETDLSADVVRHSPRPCFKRVEVRSMQFVRDLTELHDPRPRRLTTKGLH